MCENVKERVVDLEPSKMCVYPGDWTDYIYYIIATEVILLISLIAKVSYDYFHGQRIKCQNCHVIGCSKHRLRTHNENS